jgi:hypothetical protein
LLSILNEPRSLVSVLLDALALDSLMVAAHYFPEILHIVRLSGGVGLATTEATIGHGEVAFEGRTVGLLFTHDFTFVEGTVAC